MPELKKLIARLQEPYGAPEMPPARGPFELVLWENACYLLPDTRQAEVFQGLKRQVGMSADAIFKAPKEALLPLARMGGMLPETRVFRWQEIARITLQHFDANLDQILDWALLQLRASRSGSLYRDPKTSSTVPRAIFRRRDYSPVRPLVPALLAHLSRPGRDHGRVATK